MSTTFYRLKPPVTGIRVDRSNGDNAHIKITIFVNHQNAGAVLIHEVELNEFLAIFINDYFERTIRTVQHDFLREVGRLRDDDCLISEYHEILSGVDLKRKYLK